jgi:hypothetical protein
VVRVKIGTDTGRSHQLSFGQPPSGSQESKEGIVYITCDEEPYIFQVITRMPESLARGGSWFRNRSISTLKAGNLWEFEVTVKDSQGRRTWVLGRPKDRWLLSWMSQGNALRQGARFDESLARKVAEMLEEKSFRVWEWSRKEVDLDSCEISRNHFRLQINMTKFKNPHDGFRRLYLGKEILDRVPAVRWARVEPGPQDRPFFLDRATADEFFHLVDHLNEITEPSK